MTNHSDTAYVNAQLGGPDQEYFTSMQVITLTGCTYRQLDYWGRAGYLEAEIAPEGSGSVRLYSRTQVDTIATALALIVAGFATLPALRHAQALISGDGCLELSGGFIRIGQR